MNGYYGWYKNFWNGTVDPYNLAYRNCASYSRDMWYKYTYSWISFYNPALDEPGALYNAIRWLNNETGMPSQCSTGH